MSKNRVGALQRRQHTSTALAPGSPRPTTEFAQGRPSASVITWDQVPTPPDIPLPATDVSDLNADERADLNTVRALAQNRDQADWMLGKALQAARDGRYYREEFPTWERFLDVLGISAADSYRLINEWPLGERLHQSGIIAPASHVRAMLPLVRVTDLDTAVRGLAALQQIYQAAGVRLTATAVEERAKAALSGPEQLERGQTPTVFLERARERTSREAFSRTLAQRPSTTSGVTSSDSLNLRETSEREAPVEGEVIDAELVDDPPPTQSGSARWSMTDDVRQAIEAWVNTRIASTGRDGDTIVHEGITLLNEENV